MSVEISTVDRPWPADAPAILHADLDAFFASVEQRDDPTLRGRPIMVGTGIVLSASYPARANGVRTPMNGRLARSLCPDIVSVPPRMAAYAEASRAVFAVFDDVTPIVEGVSIDEAFLDVGGLRRLGRQPVDVAAELRRRVRAEVGLDISVGLATTKFLAKVASGEAKPNGSCIVRPGEEAAFLHPLPVDRLWGVGPKTAARLADLGLDTVGDIAALPPDRIDAIVGSSLGRRIHGLADNRDTRRVENRRRRSIGSQRSFPRGRVDSNDAETILLEIVDGVSSRLRAADLLTRTLVLRLRFADFGSATRSRTLAEPTSSTDTVLASARRLLDVARPEIERRGLTKVGLSLTGLSRGENLQLALPFGGHDAVAVDSAIDAVRSRFGRRAILRTGLVGRPAHWHESGVEDPSLSRKKG